VCVCVWYCVCTADARGAEQGAETLRPSGGPRGQRERQGQGARVRRQVHVQVPRRISTFQPLTIALLAYHPTHSAVGADTVSV